MHKIEIDLYHKQIKDMENISSNGKNIPILIKTVGFEPKKTNCDRCSGTGRLPQYNHVEAGICFKCRGGKYIVSYQKTH